MEQAQETSHWACSHWCVLSHCRRRRSSDGTGLVDWPDWEEDGRYRVRTGFHCDGVDLFCYEDSRVENTRGVIYPWDLAIHLNTGIAVRKIRIWCDTRLGGEYGRLIRTTNGKRECIVSRYLPRDLDFWIPLRRF